MNDNSQSRKWQLTINNPIDYGVTHDVIHDILQSLTLDYYCMTDELATTGTMHTHLFLYSISPIRFNTLKKKFPTAHIDRAYGSSLENRTYLQKSGKWENTEKHDTIIENSFEEFGNIPSENDEKAPMMSQIINAVKAGRTTASIIQEYPKMAFRVKDIDTLRETLLGEKYLKENRKVEVTYIYGLTGVGKTSSIYERHSPLDICRITSYTRDRVLFDAYHGQDVMVFEEFQSQIPLADMLNYLDIYPISLPARYTDRVACYTHVYMTSNIPLLHQYRDIQLSQPEVWQAFLRRINHIVEYLSLDQFIEHKKEDYIL